MCGLSSRVTKAASEINELTDDAGAAASLDYGIGRSRGVPGIGAWIILPNLTLLEEGRIDAADNVDFAVPAIVGNAREEPGVWHWRARAPSAAGDIVNISGVQDSYEVSSHAAKHIYFIDVGRIG